MYPFRALAKVPETNFLEYELLFIIYATCYVKCGCVEGALNLTLKVSPAKLTSIGTRDR